MNRDTTAANKTGPEGNESRLRMSSIVVEAPKYILPSLASTSEFDSIILGIRETYGDPDIEDPSDIHGFLVKIAVAESANDWGGISKSEFNKAVRLIFNDNWEDKPEFNDLRDFSISELKTTSDGAYLDCMFQVYLQTFRPTSDLTSQIALLLQDRMAKHRDDLPERAKRILIDYPEVFDVSTGPNRIANNLIDIKKPYFVLKGAGFRDIQTSGFFEQISSTYLSQIEARRSLNRKDTTNEIKNWLAPEGEIIRKRGAEHGINRLVKPYLTEALAEEDRQKLLVWLLAKYEDPRIQSEVWDDVDTQCRALVCKWLVGNTLEAFLEIITASQKHMDHKMWTNREHFWWDMHKEENIDEAWVALSPEGLREARRLYERSGDPIFTQFGLQSSRARKNTSLLIMKINGYTVVEGSHSYKVRIFKRGNSDGPDLYERSYDANKYVNSADFEQRHDTHGNWRGWVRSQVL